jgi:hypothetical protein
MKKHLLALTTLLFAASSVFAQQFELSVQANSGLFHFSGKSVTATSYVIQYGSNNQNYTNNPYGNRNGFSYGSTLQGQFVAKNGFIWGLGAGYEVLQSKVNIDKYTPLVYITYNDANPVYIDPSFAVKGHTNLQNQSINLNPYIGYRFQLHKVKLDILPGVDVGLILKTKDEGSVKDNDGKTYTVNYARSKAPTDVRLRLGAAASYGKWALNASFAHGLTNYLSRVETYINPSINGSNSTTTSLAAHSELMRLGVSYRIN